MDRLTSQYRTGQPASTPLVELRQQIADASARYPRHSDVDSDYGRWGGIRCLVLTPGKVAGNLLYFHGGGFRIGSPELATGFASHLAARSQCRVILPFYSLAPEQPFPGALLDGQAVLEDLPQTLPLLLGGDSAGGNLAAVLARRFSHRIEGVMLLSPWLDLRVTADSYEHNAEVDNVFTKSAAKEAAALYLQGHSSLDVDASPLLGELSQMPPCLISVGGNEVLLDDSLLFASKLTRYRRSVWLQVLADMAHVEVTTTPSTKHTEEVLALAAAFMRNRLDQGVPSVV